MNWGIFEQNGNENVGVVHFTGFRTPAELFPAHWNPFSDKIFFPKVCQELWGVLKRVLLDKVKLLHKKVSTDITALKIQYFVSPTHNSHKYSIILPHKATIFVRKFFFFSLTDIPFLYLWLFHKVIFDLS